MNKVIVNYINKLSTNVYFRKNREYSVYLAERILATVMGIFGWKEGLLELPVHAILDLIKRFHCSHTTLRSKFRRRIQRMFFRQVIWTIVTPNRLIRLSKSVIVKLN